MSEIKIGDTVEIVDLDGYAHSPKQGLRKGARGKVVGAEEDTANDMVAFYVKLPYTADAIFIPENGWTFWPHQLKKVEG